MQCSVRALKAMKFVRRVGRESRDWARYLARYSSGLSNQSAISKTRVAARVILPSTAGYEPEKNSRFVNSFRTLFYVPARVSARNESNEAGIAEFARERKGRERWRVFHRASRMWRYRTKNTHVQTHVHAHIHTHRMRAWYQRRDFTSSLRTHHVEVCRSFPQRRVTLEALFIARSAIMWYWSLRASQRGQGKTIIVTGRNRINKLRRALFTQPWLFNS